MARESKTRFLILGLLAEEKLSGYDIKKKIDQKMGALWMESFGQIYPELKKLTTSEMITVKSSVRQSRVYKEYSITAKGKKILLEWLKKPVETNKTIKHDILLKLFFARHLEPEDFKKHLNKFKNDYEKALMNLLKMKETLGSRAYKSKDTVYWYLSALFGETIFTALIDWSKKSLDILNKLNQ